MKKTTVRIISIIAGLILMLCGLYYLFSIISYVLSMKDYVMDIWRSYSDSGQTITFFYSIVYPQILNLVYFIALGVTGILAIIGLKKYFLAATPVIILASEILYAILFIIFLVKNFVEDGGDLEDISLVGFFISDGAFKIITFLIILIFTILTVKNVQKFSAFLWILPVVTIGISAISNIAYLIGLYSSLDVELPLISKVTIYILPNFVKLLTVFAWCAWMLMVRMYDVKNKQIQ